MGTYKDFLQSIGVSHGVFMIILIVLFLVVSFIVMLYKLGLITKIRFGLIALSKSQIVYANFSGSFEIVNTKVQQIYQETKDIFKLSNVFGIYYDPKSDANPDQMEAIIGVRVVDVQSDKIRNFIEKHNGKYKLGNMPQAKCIGTKYPYFNSASLIMIVTRVYPRLAEYVRNKKLDVGPGVIQIYHLMSSSPFVQIMAPLQKHEEFIFS